MHNFVLPGTGGDQTLTALGWTFNQHFLDPSDTCPVSKFRGPPQYSLEALEALNGDRVIHELPVAVSGLGSRAGRENEGIGRVKSCLRHHLQC